MRGRTRPTTPCLTLLTLESHALAEYEFYQFRTPSSDPAASSAPSTAAYLRENPPHSLPALTEGMFGYSLTRPVHNQDYFYDIFDTCEKFNCNIEGWHTESGPGVFEAALEFGEIAGMADRASLFKSVFLLTGKKPKNTGQVILGDRFY